ncbi:MAG: copper transporter [Propionibacteriaceae bacterium]
MINFRYHIVSLMAVFLALALGIVLGVTLLSDPANETIQSAASADRKELQDIRAELTQRNALDAYRDNYAEKVGLPLITNALQGDSVAVIAMPGAPTRVVSTISQAVTAAGGEVVSNVEVSRNVFDTTKKAEVAGVMRPLAARIGVAADATLATQYGAVLAQGLLAPTAGPVDAASTELLKGLSAARLVSVDSKVTQRASLAIVVTAPAATPGDQKPGNDVITAHTQAELALRPGSNGVVVAGPNSLDVAGTDVQVLRTAGPDAEKLSTVDVADLPSGVTTTVLALQEQSLDGQGHYGATGDAVAPDLPIR